MPKDIDKSKRREETTSTVVWVHTYTSHQFIDAFLAFYLMHLFTKSVIVIIMTKSIQTCFCILVNIVTFYS